MSGRAERRTAGAVVVSVAGLVGIVVVVGLATGVGLSVRGDEEPSAAPPGASGPAATGSVAATGPAATPPSAAPDPSADPRVAPMVRLAAEDPSRFAPAPTALGDLDDGAVIRFEAVGFAPDTTGTVRQCAPEAGRLGRCGNPLPIRFDDAGHAVVQYQVWQDGTGGKRDCTEVFAPCFAVIDDGDGGVARVRTLFGRAAGAGAEVSVTPASGVRPGDAVMVGVSGFPPGAVVYPVVCRPPGQWGGNSCAEAVAQDAMTVGPDGSAARRIEIGSCPPGRACGIVVGSDDVAAAPAAVVSFRSGPGAGYDLRRTLGGIAVAAAFVVGAWWLWRRTDWSPPTEAATPELDRSELW